MKRERWGSLLVQEKYREEMACDKRHPYRIIIIIIIIIVVIIIIITGLMWLILLYNNEITGKASHSERSCPFC